MQESIELLTKGWESTSTNELIKTLQTTKVDAKIRIALGRYLFESKHHVIPDKEHFLVHWIFRTLVAENFSNQKKKKKENLLFFEHSFWELLCLYLQSEALPLMMPREEILFPMATVYSLAMSKETRDIQLFPVLEEVFQLLFSKFSTTFLPTIRNFVLYLSSIFRAIATELIEKKKEEATATLESPKQVTKDETDNQVYNQFPGIKLAQLVLEKFIQMTKGGHDHKMIFNLVVTDLLQTLLLVWHCFKQEKKFKGLTALVEELMQDIFFHPMVFEEAQSSKNTKKRKKNNQQITKEDYKNMFLERLNEFLSLDTPLCLATYGAFPHIFKLFLKTLTIKRQQTLGMDMSTHNHNQILIADHNEKDIAFHFLIQLHGMAEAHISLPVEEQSKIATKASAAWSAVNSLFQLVAKHNIYMLDNRNSDKGEFLQRHLKIILSPLKLTKKDTLPLFLIDGIFASFSALVKINHLFTDDHLSQIMTNLWLIPHQELELTACDSFSVSLLEQYSLIRQVDVFLKKISEILRTAVVVQFFPHNSFWKRYTECVTSLPIGQISPIWKQFIEEITEHYLETIIQNIYQLKKSKTTSIAEDPNSNLSSNFGHIVSLFVVFINAVTVSAQNFSELYGYAKRTLTEILMPILLPLLDRLNNLDIKNINPSLLFSSLYLFLTCKKFVSFCKLRYSMKDKEAVDSTCPPFFQDIFSEVKLGQFITILSVDSNPKWKILQHSLIVERINELYIIVKSQSLISKRDVSLEAELKELLKLHLSGYNLSKKIKYPELLIKELWDGKILSINKENYLHAYSHLLCNTYVILSEYAEESDLQLFLSFLLRIVCYIPMFKKTNEDIQNKNCILGVFGQLFLNAQFYEMKRFQANLVPLLLSFISQSALDYFDFIELEDEYLKLKKLLKSYTQPHNNTSDVQQPLKQIFNNLYTTMTLKSGDRKKKNVPLNEPNSSHLQTLVQFGQLLYALPPSALNQANEDCIQCCLIVDTMLTNEILLLNDCETETLSCAVDVMRQVISKMGFLVNLSKLVIPETILWQWFVYLPLYNKLRNVFQPTTDIIQAFGRSFLENKQSTCFSHTLHLLQNLAMSYRNDSTGISMVIEVVNCLLDSVNRQLEVLKVNKKKKVILQSFVKDIINLESTLVEIMPNIELNNKNTKNHIDLSTAISFECLAHFLDFHCLVILESKDIPKTVIPHVGQIVLAIFRFFIPSQTTTKETYIVENNKEDISKKMLCCLNSVTKCYGFFQPPISLENFGTLTALIHHLLVLKKSGELPHVEAGDLENVHKNLVHNANKEQFQLLFEHILYDLGCYAPCKQRKQLVSLLVALNRLDQLIRETDHLIRNSIKFRVVGILVEITNKAASLFINEEDQQQEVIIVESLKILTLFVSNQHTPPVPVVLQSMSSFQLAEHVNTATLRQLRKRYPNEPLHWIQLDQKAITEPIFMAYSQLLTAMIMYHPNFTFKHAPTYLLCMRYLMYQIAKTQKSKKLTDHNEISNKLPPHCAIALSRLYFDMADHKEKAKQFVVFLITDYIKLLKKQALAEQTKSKLIVGIYALFNICSEYELKQIFGPLDEKSKSLFRSLYSDFERDHKFTGKV